MLKPEKLLRKEKLDLLSFANGRKFSLPICSNLVSLKNAGTSIRFRKEGNALYKRLNPLGRLLYHELLVQNVDITAIWNLYTLSIVFAPSNSEELAYGYGNISSLFLYISSFDDCIKACDQGLSITSCSYLKLKLLYRKAKSLYMLNKSPKEVCEEALKLLEKLKLDEKIKDDYKEKLTELRESNILASDNCKLCGGKHYSCNQEELLNFERSPEIPCASKSIAIKYNKKWGRHIVAIEDIQPGEIIAIEKFCLNFLRGQNKHQFCGNCMNYVFMYNIIPCEYCTDNIYCSETCRKEAWKKYHQFECRITMLLSFNESLQNNTLAPLRMVLFGVYQAGNLEKMKELLLEIENGDARNKGFSNGVFEAEKMKSILSLSYKESLDDVYKLIFLQSSCISVFLLAKYTNFFGEKMNVTESNMFLNQDILFTAALFLRCCYINIGNSNMILRETEVIGFHLRTFGSLFNHSCDPNVKFSPTKSSQDIYFSLYPIKKGSQLFLAYHRNDFLNKPKECRQKDLQEICNFICDCVACEENWSNICLPSLKDVLKIAPALALTPVLTDIVKLDLEEFESKDATAVSLKREQIILYLQLLSKHFTVYCREYRTLLKCLERMYVSVEIC